MDIKPEITRSDFEKIDMRVGTIISAVVFEKARKPAYQLEIDFGDLGIKSLLPVSPIFIIRRH